MDTRGRQIIVGYNGSSGSTDALDWAVREARLRYLPLTICHAWTAAPAGVAVDNALPGVAADAVVPGRENAEAVLAQGVSYAQACDPSVTPRPLPVCGPPTRVLCRQCAGTGMLVVGSRGCGGLEGLLHHAYQATTMTFIGMIFGQIRTAFAVRVQRAYLRSVGVFSNRYLLLAVAAELAIAAVLVYAPTLQALPGTAAVPARFLVILLPYPLIVWGADELRKFVIRRHAPRSAQPSPAGAL
jgi:nucleotide-binding universal stress UspA family protein